MQDDQISTYKAKRLAEAYLISQGLLNPKYSGCGPLKMLCQKLHLKFVRDPVKAVRIQRRKAALRAWALKHTDDATCEGRDEKTNA